MISVSYLRCPLCGRLVHLNSFNPEDYDDDINLVDMTSLGRGRGFAKVGEYSALGDEVLMGRIARRLHSLHVLIEGKKPGEPMLEALRLKELEESNWRLDDAVEELEDEVRSLEEQLKIAREKIMEYEDAAEEEDDEIEELLSLVNNALSTVYLEAFDDLDSAVRALVDEYQDAMEEAEDQV